jgi:hypothetical protein
MKRSLFVAYLVILAAYSWLVTYGTGEFFGVEWLSESFDSLASSLVHGKAGVDPEAIGFEGLKRNGETYMYFGPFPALLRMVFNSVLPDHVGLWGRVSCLLAAILSACTFGFIVTRSLRLNPSLDDRQRTILASILILSFSLGTPLLYLVSCGRIFHEASLWGLCGALWGLYGILLLCTGSERPILGRVIFSFALAISLLSRITFALPMCIAAPIVFLWRMGPEGRVRGGAVRTALLRLVAMMPAVIGVVIQLWYNNERFGAIFRFFDYTSFYISPAEIGGEFNLARIPTAIKHYFGFFWGYLSESPPFIRMINSEIARPEIFMRHWREQTISLTFASCAIMLFAARGFAALCRGRAPALLVVYCTCLLSEAFVILAYFFITQRYAADFLPLITGGVVAAALTISYRRKLVVTLGILSVMSVAATILSDLDWSMAFNEQGPNAFRRNLAKAFLPPLSLGEGRDRTYLSEVGSLMQSDSGVKTQMNKSALGNPLSWVGVRFPKGVGMRANASVTFPVAPGFDRLQAIVIPAFESIHCFDSAMEFKVSNDKDEVLFSSGIMRARSLPRSVDVSLDSTSSITLSLSGIDGRNDCDFGNWNMVSLVKSEPTGLPTQ